MVKVSVIIPVYNASKYIGHTIENVQSQTLGDWELILVNDGSIDNSEDCIKKYVAKDPRIRLLTQKNAGPAVARNRAMEAAEGKYILCLDADDEFSKEMLKTMFDEAEHLHADILMCGIETVSTTGEHIQLHHGMPTGHLLSDEEIAKYAIALYFQPQPCGISSLCTKFFRTEWLRKNNLKLREDLVRAEDWMFILDCFQVKPTVRFAAIEEIFYSYKIHENSVMRSYRKGEFRQVFEHTRYLHEVGKKFGINKPSEFYRAIIANSIEYIISINRSDDLQKKNEINEIIHHPDFKTSLKHIGEFDLPKRFIIVAWLFRLGLNSLALRFC